MTRLCLAILMLLQQLLPIDAVAQTQTLLTRSCTDPNSGSPVRCDADVLAAASARQNASGRNFDIQDYGAACNAPTAYGANVSSATDDAPAINRALAAAGAAGGGVVLGPHGKNCRINETLMIPPGVDFTGEDWWTSQITAGATSMTMIAYGNAVFLGGISGTTLTVTQMIGGTLAVNQTIGGYGLNSPYSGTSITISAFGTGTGGTGTYTVNASQNVAANTLISATNGILHAGDIRNLRLNGNGVGTPSGTAIYVPPATALARIEHVKIENPCFGIDINGNGNTISNSAVESVSGGNQCEAIRVGFGTTGGQTTGLTITNTLLSAIRSPLADAGVAWFDCGGCNYVNNANGPIQFNFGTKVYPKCNQYVAFTSTGHSVYGDTSVTNGLFMDTQCLSAKIIAWNSTADWVSSSTGSNIVLRNTGGGEIDGVHFNQLRNYNSILFGAAIFTGVNDWSFDDAHFCGDSNGGSDITLEGANGPGAVRNSQVKGGCDGFGKGSSIGGGFQATVGINIATPLPANLVVFNNDFTGTTTPVIGAPTGASIVKDNIGIDTATVTVAAAASVNLAPNVSRYVTLTGNATIGAITSNAWSNRRITVVPTGTVKFTSSPSICNSFTPTSRVPFHMFYNATSGCWYQQL